MAILEWDKAGARQIRTGTDHGILFPMAANGSYDEGIAWSGLTGVTETPAGAEPTKIYADNIPYLTLISAETFSATINAYQYPPEFAKCDGSAELAKGVTIGQQARQKFGLAFRVKISTDTNTDAGYEYHLLYGLTASPSERAYATVNESPEAITFSWTASADTVNVKDAKPTSLVTINGLIADQTKLTAFLKVLNGDQTTDSRLPLPDEIKTMFA